MRLAVAILVAAVWVACGKAQFDPECQVPVRGDVARPIAAVPLPGGGIAVANADTNERFCGGFVSWFAHDGSEFAAPSLVQVPEGYEANFSSAAFAGDNVWLPGRRYGYLIGLKTGTDREAFLERNGGLRRVFDVDDETFVTYDGTALKWRGSNGRIRNQIRGLGSGAPRSLTLNQNTGWLGYDGGKHIAVLDLDTYTVSGFAFPLGVGPDYNTRGIAYLDGRVASTDHARGVVLLWDAETGEAVGAETVGVRPERVALGPGNCLWALDATGGLYLRREAGDWRLIEDNFNRPTDLAVSGDRVWVTDFGANTVRHFEAAAY